MKKRLRIPLMVISAFLIIFSLFSCSLFEDDEALAPLYDKDEIIATMEAGTAPSSTYVFSYLKYWRFPKFDQSRFRDVENTFRKHYVEELPAADILAKGTADLFFEYFFDTVDLHDEETVTSALLNCYTYALGDDYAVYRTPSEYEDYTGDMSGEITGIGVQVLYDRLKNTCLIESVTPGSGAEEAGIRPSDYIIAVDDKQVSELGYLDTISSVRGEIGTRVKITVLRGEEELSFIVTRSLIVQKTVTYSISDDKIGYIKLTEFKGNTGKQFIEAVDALEEAGCIGVVYDLRSNPGGYLSAVLECLSYIFPKGQLLVSFSNNYASAIASDDKHTFLLPTVVLCNEHTASAGELFTAAVRDLAKEGVIDAKIVGTTTYGKGIMQNTYTFYDGASITMTVAYYNPPCGENYHKKGIVPDVECTDDDTIVDVAYAEISKFIKK